MSILKNNKTERRELNEDNFITRYDLETSYDKECDDAASMFNNFLSKVSFEIDKPMYVIIDEYDHFANELLSFQAELLIVIYLIELY